LEQALRTAFPLHAPKGDRLEFNYPNAAQFGKQTLIEIDYGHIWP
jgi:hypothetical protein